MTDTSATAVPAPSPACGLATDVLSVRPFAPGDERRLWALYRATIHSVLRDDYTEAQRFAWAPADIDLDAWDRCLRELAPFVAEIGGQIVGYADVQASGYIGHFFVHHERQRQGIGRALFDRIRAQALGRGAYQLYSDVSITGRAFFESCGFEAAGRRTVATRGQVLVQYRMVRSVAADGPTRLASAGAGPLRA